MNSMDQISTVNPEPTLQRVSTMLAGPMTRSQKRMGLNNLSLHECAIKIQRKFRERLYSKRVHCKNLADRLIFESDLMKGTVRLLKQILVFALIMIALGISSNERVKRGIYLELDNSFNFDQLELVQSSDDFTSKWVSEIATNSKKYFIRSSKYFDSSGAGIVELHTSDELFAKPKLLGGLSLSVYLPVFSFTAWVKMGSEFSNGYVFRKRLQAAGDGSDLSCWGESYFKIIMYSDGLWKSGESCAGRRVVLEQV
jgi:hypothetical protein